MSDREQDHLDFSPEDHPLLTPFVLALRKLGGSLLVDHVEAEAVGKVTLRLWADKEWLQSANPDENAPAAIRIEVVEPT